MRTKEARRARDAEPEPKAATEPEEAAQTKRDVSITGQFKRDVRREQRGPHGATLWDVLDPIIERLANDLPLEVRLRDHPLTGNWSSHRDCHVRPDLVLIYKKVDPPLVKPPRESERPKLILVRIGSHSELGIG